MNMSGQVKSVFQNVPVEFQTNFLTIKAQIFENYIKHLQKNSGNPISPCDCSDLRSTNYSENFQNIIQTTLLSKCTEICNKKI